MNLMKLFNFNYFKENLKKSKGLLAFFFGLIPLLNIIMLLLIIINDENVLMNFNNLSIITFIGMYFIPYILAYSLIGFIFKRKSVDFVLSKPVNRKSIYITSFLGGILLIFIYMLLNSLIFLIFNIAIDIVIPFSLIIDYFLYFLVSYIFMFTISLLAISLSGNFIASIIVTLIVICLFPFFKAINYAYYNNTSNYVTASFINAPTYNCDNNSTCNQHLKNNEYHLYYRPVLKSDFTAPLIFLNNDKLIYNSKSLIKMLILIIIYTSIGYYIFLKRKMENNETSFKNEILHYIVKTITLIPICFIEYIILKELEFPTDIIICGASILIYQIIYDLITRKEIYKLKKSLLITTISCIIFISLYSLYDNIDKTKAINLDNITSLRIPLYLDYNYGDNNLYLSRQYYEIKDQTLIKNMINDTLNNNRTSNRAIININNQEYEINILDSNYREEINAMYQNTLLKDFTNTNINKIISPDLKLTKKLKNILQDTLNQPNLRLAKSSDEILTIYKYQDHEYKSFAVPYNLNQKLDKYVLTEKNKEFINILENSTYINFYTYDPNNIFSDLDLYVFNYVLTNCKNELINYLTTENTIFTNNTLEIGFNNYKESTYYPIGDTKKFKEEYVKWQNKLSDKEEYQDLIKRFKEATYEY